jgi:hypothetical protein
VPATHVAPAQQVSPPAHDAPSPAQGGSASTVRSSHALAPSDSATTIHVPRAMVALLGEQHRTAITEGDYHRARV